MVKLKKTDYKVLFNRAMLTVKKQTAFIKKQSSTLKRATDVIAKQSARIKELTGDTVPKISKTKYFTGNPDKPGIYHTSTQELVEKYNGGGALAIWTGTKWKKYKNWGSMFDRKSPCVWYGEGKDRRQPLTVVKYENQSDEIIDNSEIA